MNQTNARHRAFSFRPGTSDEAPAAELEPITFEVYEGGATIHCVEDIDGFQLLLFTAVMGPGFTGAERSRAMTDFIKKAIVRDDYNLFLAEVAQAKLEIEDVGTICAWLSDVYAERPTKSAQSSLAGQTTTGSSSGGTSPLGDLTGDGSAPPTS